MCVQFIASVFFLYVTLKNMNWVLIVTTLWGIKNTPIFFHHNLKKSDPILTNFGRSIFDTTGHQMTV